MVDVMMVGILAVLLGLVFFAYLMIRRTLTGFKEGVERGKGGGG